MSSPDLRASTAVIVLVVGAVGCGGSTPPPSSAPLTDSDPPPYTPPPEESAHTGAVTGIATTGGYEQARAATVRLIVAVRDGDEATLEQLLDDPLGQVYPRLTAASRTRRQALDQIARARQSANVGPDTPIEELIDSAQLEVRPLSERGDGTPPPPGLDDNDLLVTFPLSAAGRRLFRASFGWPHRGSVVVRTTPTTRIVAL